MVMSSTQYAILECAQRIAELLKRNLKQGLWHIYNNYSMQVHRSAIIRYVKKILLEGQDANTQKIIDTLDEFEKNPLAILNS